jgi:hypothetical protein
MKATFTSKLGFKVTVEPMKKQTKEQLLKHTERIQRKRKIKAQIKIENNNRHDEQTRNTKTLSEETNRSKRTDQTAS